MSTGGPPTGWRTRSTSPSGPAARCTRRAPRRVRSGRRRPARSGGPAHQGSPAALAPLAEVRSLGADRRVLPVPGIDPGLVGQRPEQPLLDVVDQAGEAGGVLLRVPHATGKK